MDLINITLIMIGIANLFLALVIYSNKIKDSRVNYIFSLLAFNVSAWSLSMAFFRWTDVLDNAMISLKILYSIPIFIPLLLLYFVYIFVEEKYKPLNKKLILCFLVIWSATILTLTIFTDYFLVNLLIPRIGEKIIVFGNMYIFYIMHFVLIFSMSFLLLIKKYFTEKNIIFKTQIKYLFLGTFISSFIGMVTNLILPWFGFYSLNWLGNIMTIFLIGFVLYAMLKYKLFDTKIITTEIFIIFILITLFFDLFFINSIEELAIKTFVLLSVVILGYIIIQGMYKEVEAREKIEKLAEKLKDANKTLKRMDKQKSEFVSMASHQLRAPIASLKGYSSMILEGSYGKISKNILNVVDRIFKSSQSLSFIIDDFLTLSRIERGKIEFSFAKNNLKDTLEEVVDQIKIIAKEKNIKINYLVNKGKYVTLLDNEKIKQALFNILSNSIKYTPKGKIDINLTNKNKKILLVISDTGIGISKNNISKLFKKFHRLDNANEVNIKGNGLGLYLAKEIISAHKGKIWAESKGEGKGSTFFIELKIK